MGGDLMVLCSPCSNSWWNMFDLINLLNANIFGREDGVEGMAFVSVLIECRFLCHVSIATNPCRFWPFSNYSSSAVETLYMTLLFLCGARRHWKLRYMFFLIPCRSVNYFMTCYGRVFWVWTQSAIRNNFIINLAWIIDAVMCLTSLIAPIEI